MDRYIEISPSLTEWLESGPKSKPEKDCFLAFLETKVPSERKVKRVPFGHLLALRLIERGLGIPEEVAASLTSSERNEELKELLGKWNALDFKENNLLRNEHKGRIILKMTRVYYLGSPMGLWAGLDRYKETLDDLVGYIQTGGRGILADEYKMRGQGIRREKLW